MSNSSPVLPSEDKDAAATTPSADTAAQSVSAETPPSPTTTSKPAVEPDPFSKKLKHFLLKVIDISALGFLEPVVRLAYGEEPQVQLNKIFRFIVVPYLCIDSIYRRMDCCFK